MDTLHQKIGRDQNFPAGEGLDNRAVIPDAAAEALMRLGHEDVAKEFLLWFADYQFANGKVPCCVDERGADPVPEHDSPGELIFLVAEVYRYTGDRRLLEEMWPRIEAAMRYLESLRQSGRTDANLTPATRAFYGLLPASISHEGYAAKPMHSYWDDFWALKGYHSAIAIASALGRHDPGQTSAEARHEIRDVLDAPLRHATAAHGIPHLPGAAELGDFEDLDPLAAQHAAHGPVHTLLSGEVLDRVGDLLGRHEPADAAEPQQLRHRVELAQAVRQGAGTSRWFGLGSR